MGILVEKKAKNKIEPNGVIPLIECPTYRVRIYG